MHCRLATLLLFSAPVWASGSLQVWWPDGAGLEITTKSTGAVQPQSSRGMEKATPPWDYHRIVYGKDTVLFAYDISARKANDGAVDVHINPVDKDRVRVGGNGKWLDLPTFTRARKVSALRPGDAFELAILHNPKTGEQITDVLEVLAKPKPVTRDNSAGDIWQVDDPRVLVNGAVVRERSPERRTNMTGGGLMLYLPGRGAYYFSPTEQPGFRAAGWVDRNALRFHAGDALIEILSTNWLLPSSEVRTIWVMHDPKMDMGPKSTASFTCGNSAAQLMELNGLKK